MKKENQITHKKYIGNVSIVIAILFIMISEWNFYEWYLKISPYNMGVMAFAVCIAFCGYFKGEQLKDWKLIVVLACVLIAVCFNIFEQISFKGVVFVIAFCLALYLAQHMSFSLAQLFVAITAIAVFFVYWTIDVKGYFKGYDTSYGAMILLCGYMASIAIIEALRFIVKSKDCVRYGFINWIKANSFVIVYFEILISVVGIGIMLWYQSKCAVVGLMTFLALLCLPCKFLAQKPVYYTISIGTTMYMGVRWLWAFLVLSFDMDYVCATIMTLGLVIVIVGSLAECGKRIEKGYFYKISYAAIVVMVLVSANGIFLTAQPFPLIYLCFICYGNALTAKNIGVNYTPIDIEQHKKYLKNSFKNQFAVSVTVALMPAVMIFARIPMEVYFGNQKDLIFSLKEMLPTVGLLGVGFVLVVGLLIASLDKGTYTTSVGIMFIAGVMMYLQDMFFNTKLSESDGTALEIASLGKYPVFNALCWGVGIVTLVAALFLCKKHRNKFIFVGACYLIAIQLVAVISLPITNRIIDHDMTYGLSSNREFVLSGNKNTIIFIMDMMGTIQVDRAVEEFDDVFDGLEDFTYFTNADSCYAPTYPSITHMFTGENLDFSYSSAYEWLEHAWTNDKVEKYYDFLNDQGVEFDMYTKDIEYEFGSGNNIYNKFDNIVIYTHVTDKTRLVKTILEMAMFRTVPYLVKPQFSVTAEELNAPVERIGDAEPFEYYNWDFVERKKTTPLSTDPSVDKAVKVYHISGTHSPRLLNKNGETQDEDVSFGEAAYVCLGIVKDYIMEMKREGVYDNATVIITADHGATEGITDPQPIFIMKKSGGGENHVKMNYSSAPISHDNLMATIYDSFGFEYDNYGRSVDDYEKDELRERKLYITSEDRKSFLVYKYYGDRNDLLKKFPDRPDQVIENTLQWKKWRNMKIQ